MGFNFIQVTKQDRPYLLNLRKLTMVEHLESEGIYLSDAEHEFRLIDECEYCRIVFFQKKE